ncbi:unnamed protein product [Paramecium octaurelia]|uniref:Uncharacterized protein n=1 Tax=Paramecium octaurelia TaxID=43137 RepID=A0A8S1YPD2_PAROT|nr:unnamed protein product [Paramecium octaurelia]
MNLWKNAIFEGQEVRMYKKKMKNYDFNKQNYSSLDEYKGMRQNIGYQSGSNTFHLLVGIKGDLQKQSFENIRIRNTSQQTHEMQLKWIRI